MLDLPNYDGDKMRERLSVEHIEEPTRVRISVISVPSATERRQATAAMLEGHDFEWSFFDAHTELACEELRYDEALVKEHFGRVLGQHEIAVCSSHYAVWKEFLKSDDADYLLVLEDDVILDVNFPIRKFACFCGRCGIDYVRLFGKHYAHATRIGFFYDRSVVRFTTTPAGAQAYILSRAGAKRLVDYCRSIDATIDLIMDRFWETGLPIYSIFPYPAIERYGPTSIPIPVNGGSCMSRTERFKWNVYRAINKFRKVFANRQLSPSDGRLRARMPVFEQIFGANRSGPSLAAHR